MLDNHRPTSDNTDRAMDSHNSHYSYGRITPSPLLQNSAHIFDPKKAFAWYFQSHIVGNADHIAARPEAYIASLDATIDKNPHLKNLPVNTLLMVAIPVSGNECEAIYKTLKLYALQSRAALRRTQFVVIVNREKNGDISEEEIRQTYSEIARSQKNFPELRITLLSIDWPKTFAKKRRGGLYSAALKIATDTCLRAAQKRQVNPLVLINDANPRSISKNYLLQYIRALSQNPTADVFLGKIHWDTGRMRSVPGYGFTTTVLMTAQDRLRESRNDMPLDSWAANSGFRASALAALGGVDGNIGIKGNSRGLGADIDLGRRFFAARHSNDHVCMVHEAWVDSYGDRLLRQYLCNKSLTRSWDECDNNASSNGLRLFVDVTENVAADFDHIRRRIEYLLGLMFSDKGWACFDDETIITAALSTTLLGTPDYENNTDPLWHISGKRDNRRITFTPKGSQQLRDLLPHLADLIHESLVLLDDTEHAELHANKQILKARLPNPTATISQKRSIGSRALSSTA